MKRFIICFIISILFLALAIGQCNNTSEESDIETTSYSNEVTQEEYIVESVQEKKTEMRDDEVSESNLYGIVRLSTKIPSQLLSRIAYVLSYNKETLCPNWVAWKLTAEHTDGEVKRIGAYFEDEEVPEPRATKADYRGSGWSHGHMCPAGDNKWDETAMKESNLLTNMCPQDRGLNSGVWNKIEQDCRKWARKYGEVYIVCGPVLLNRVHETIGVNRVVVPEAFFKVVLCLTGKPKAIGFVIRNNGGTKKRDQFVNTVDEVERITGMDFFPALPDDIEDEVEAHANLEEWK